MYIKALHIIFIVTWFAGLFYMPRLFVYNTEAEEKSEPAKTILHEQFRIMMTRLWYGITIPSAVLTIILGPAVMFADGWYRYLFANEGRWLLIKLVLVILLYLYFFSLHKIFRDQLKGIFKYTSQQLRIWNEMATILLVAIVMLAVVKQSMSLLWGLTGLVLFILVLMSMIKIYKIIRAKKTGQ
ncbi:MAG TPA: CopD family protein [Puia sp.]|nr:CopD family protein [Puia sp.]